MSAEAAAFAGSGHEQEESDENFPPSISASGSGCRHHNSRAIFQPQSEDKHRSKPPYRSGPPVIG
jgi:hypothetical protein